MSDLPNNTHTTEDEDDEIVAVRERWQPEGADEKTETPRDRRLRKRLKVVYWTLGILLVVIVLLVLMRDILIEGVIRKVGSMATGTEVNIESFSSSLFAGRIEMTGFRVGNPEGYLVPEALTLDHVVVQVQPMSLFSDKIVVDEVTVSGLAVDVEVMLDGSCNLVDIQRNIERFAGLDEKVEEGEEETPEVSGAATKEVVIHLLRVSNVKALLSSALLNTELTLTLPAVELTDIGEGKTFGETLNDLFLELLAAIADGGRAFGITSENFKALGDALSQTGRDTGRALEKVGRDTLDAITEGGGNVGEELQKGVDAVRQLFEK